MCSLAELDFYFAAHTESIVKYLRDSAQIELDIIFEFTDCSLPGKPYEFCLPAKQAVRS